MTGEGLPAPGPHGGDVHRLARALGRPVTELLDLSASLNPVAPDVGPVLAAAARTGADPEC